MKKPTLVLLAAWLAGALAYPLGSSALAENGPQDAEATAAPRVATTVGEDYRIVEEDLLKMDVLGEPQFSNMQMQVTPDGKINVPFLGMMPAAGLTQAEITQQIAKALADADILYNARIQISILSMHERIARVLGQVNRPGAIVFKDGDTIIDAIAQAGSVTDNAWLEKARLTNKDSDRPINIDLRKMLEKGDMSENFPLQEGDTIYIPPEDYNNKFYVFGHVYKPNIYDLKENTTLLTAISMAGGATERGRIKATTVVRGSRNKPEIVPCNLTRLFDKGDLSQDIALEPGDIVIVPETRKPDWGKISAILSTILNVTYIRRLGLF